MNCTVFSDGARCEVYENGGVEKLAKLLTAQLAAEPDSPKTLPRVACGFLFNLVNTHGLYAVSRLPWLIIRGDFKCRCVAVFSDQHRLACCHGAHQ